MKPKILILYNKIFHYRIPIFNLLAEKYDLTVAYNYGKIPNSNLNFKTKKLHPYKLWKFTLQKENIHKLSKKYDVVIAYGEFAYLKYSLLAIRKNRKYPLLYWGTGAPASYTRKYGEGSKLYLKTSYFFSKRGDGYIAYTEEGKKFLEKLGFEKQKLFVAPNTVHVLKNEINSNKKSILFIGTLYPQKGIYELLKAYKDVTKKNQAVPILEIIGDGPLKEEIINWIQINNLSCNIIMHGAVYTPQLKKEIFNRAIACISPKQAGLGVLESMGYGVPYITCENAITGGEIFNIENGITGKIVPNHEPLVDVLQEIIDKPQLYHEMGEKAFKYYWEKRKPEDMAMGLSNAIDSIFLSQK